MRCSVCGKKIERTYYINGECSDRCFKQRFWQKALKTGIIINGNCYQVGDENTKSTFRGFDGRKIYIRMKTGKVIVTTNLWHNGKIPKRYMKKDNAKFIKPLSEK